MAKLTKFQIIVLAIFSAGILIGLGSLALVKNNGGTATADPVVVWGVWSKGTFDGFLAAVNNDRSTPLSVTYVQKEQSAFEKELTEELALGKGPDAILVPQEMLLTFENKLVTIPYTSFTARDFKDSFIEQAELYLRNDGIVGIPFAIDPMVMYWNRDTFTNAGLATYPKIWDDYVDLTKKLNQKDVNANIRKSAVALGEFANISNARDIFSLILLQSGNPITSNKESILGGPGLEMTTRSLSFFNTFSNPSSPAYSWNRSLPLSRNFFLSGNLATYFGYASEVRDLREKNPNLNYDVAPMPQPKDAKIKVNYGRMYGFSIVKSTKNPGNTLATIFELTTPTSQNILVSQTYLPPIRRDLIAQGNNDPYLAIFYNAALVSKGWLDPDPYASARLFQTLSESVTSGRSTVTQAINDAHTELDLLLQKR